MLSYKYFASKLFTLVNVAAELAKFEILFLTLKSSHADAQRIVNKYSLKLFYSLDISIYNDDMYEDLKRTPQSSSSVQILNLLHYKALHFKWLNNIQSYFTCSAFIIRLTIFCGRFELFAGLLDVFSAEHVVSALKLQTAECQVGGLQAFPELLFARN